MLKNRKAGSALIALVATLSLFLTGCSSDKEPPPADTDEFGNRVAVDTLHRPAPTTWESVEKVGDRTLRIHFTTITEPNCYRHQPHVTWNEDTIVITLISGVLPDYQDYPTRACIPITEGDWTPTIEEVSMLVETYDPIGDREIIDGGQLIYDEISDHDSNSDE